MKKFVDLKAGLPVKYTLNLSLSDLSETILKDVLYYLLNLIIQFINL